MSYRLSFMRPVVFDPGLYGEYGGPANGGFAGTGTNNSYSTRGDLDARVQRQDRARRPRRPELLPQRHVDRRATGLTTSTDVGIPGREPRRLHQRHLADQHRRLLRSGARLLGEPAVGSLGEDLERRGDADPAAEHAHGQVRRRVAAQQRHAAADAGRRRPARPVHLQRARAPACPAESGVARAASPTRWRRSCSTGRTACSAT